MTGFSGARIKVGIGGRKLCGGSVGAVIPRSISTESLTSFGERLCGLPPAGATGASAGLFSFGLSGLGVLTTSCLGAASCLGALLISCSGALLIFASVLNCSVRVFPPAAGATFAAPLISSVGLAAGGLGTTRALGATATGGLGRSGATGLGSLTCGGGETLINDCFGVAGRSALSDGGRSTLSLGASLIISLRTPPLPAPALGAFTGTGTTFSGTLAVLGDAAFIAGALGGATISIFGAGFGSILATGLGSF